MNLNERRNWVLIASAVLLVAELIYAPTARCTYQGCYPTGYYDFIWNRGLNEQIHASGLILTWVGTLLVGAVLFLLFQEGKGRPQDTETSSKKPELRPGAPQPELSKTTPQTPVLSPPESLTHNDPVHLAQTVEVDIVSQKKERENQRTSGLGMMILIGIGSALGAMLARAFF